MYTTIEVDIIHGQVKGSELNKRPVQAHVLIALLSFLEKVHPTFGTCTSEGIQLDADIFDPFSEDELGAWGLV